MFVEYKPFAGFFEKKFLRGEAHMGV